MKLLRVEGCAFGEKKLSHNSQPATLNLIHSHLPRMGGGIFVLKLFPQVKVD
jgi:hypothetical protein